MTRSGRIALDERAPHDRALERLDVTVERFHRGGAHLLEGERDRGQGDCEPDEGRDNRPAFRLT